MGFPKFLELLYSLAISMILNFSLLSLPSTLSIFSSFFSDKPIVCSVMARFLEMDLGSKSSVSVSPINCYSLSKN